MSVSERIRLAEKKYHRVPQSVVLLAVSKKQPVEKMRELYLAGQKRFAENYAQEALKKMPLLTDLDIEWHFIGSIQSNKTKLIAVNFEWVHSINHLEIAERLNAQRPAQLPSLNICIEVNIDYEKTKSGVLPEKVKSFAKELLHYKNLRLRGLMVIPAKNNSPAAFEKTAQLQKELITTGFELDTLSMGMSADFELAIAAGSTMVRIGTAIFGER
ncbi:MAG: hypothetical protein ACD_42C00290G0002 [uncultured bacterium]|nr:MAG: hypothetical protein ACD_42C00290G0002 [uncultured bacterium]